MKALQIFKGLLITQMNHCVLCMAGITVLRITGSSSLFIPQFILLGALPFLLFIVRCYTDGLLSFAGSHAVLITVSYLYMVYPRGDNLAAAVVFSVYIAAYAIASFILRVKVQDRREKPLYPAVAAVFLVILLLLQRYLVSPDFDYNYAVSYIIFIALYFIDYYLKQFQHFLLINKDISGHFPERAMLKTGVRQVGIFTLLGVFFLFIVSRIELLPELINRIMMLLVTVIRVIIEFFSRFSREKEYEPLEMARQADDLLLLLQEEEGEPTGTPWLLYILFACMLTAAVVYGLKKLYEFLRERFGMRMNRQSRDLFSVTDVREKVEVIKRKPANRRLLEFLSPRERIRRIYKKRVLAGRHLLAQEDGQQSLNYLTASKCGQILGAEILAGIYEKARYSNEQCSPEDVRAAKSGKAVV